MNINHQEKRQVYISSYKKHLHMIEVYKSKLNSTKTRYTFELDHSFQHLSN